MTSGDGKDLVARYRLALNVARHVNSSLDVEEVMGRAIDLLIREVGAERGFVMLRERDGSLSPHALRRIDPSEVTSDRFRMSRTLLHRVVHEGEPILTADAQTDQRLAGRASVIGLGLRSIIAVPLKVRDQIEGVVYLDDTRRLNAFTDTDLELVTFLSELIAIAVANARSHNEVLAARDVFSRYVNHQVADAAGSGEALSFEGARVDVAVLNSDLRGFSTISRGMEAPAVVAMLNEWLRGGVDSIIDYGGNIDKYIGDAVLAVFGAPVPVEGPVRRAVIAAVEMMGSVMHLNDRRRSRGEEPLAIGTGIDFGEVVAGNMGSERRLEYTVIGSPVNNAAWLAGNARPMEILVTGSAWAELGGTIKAREQLHMPLKGAAEEYPVFSVDWEPMVD
jgi:adenylate cyclase